MITMLFSFQILTPQNKLRARIKANEDQDLSFSGSTKEKSHLECLKNGVF